MQHKKLVRSCGIPAVVLGLMITTAGGAHANWLVTAPPEPEVTLAAKVHSETNLLVKEETNLEILCATLKSSAANPITLLAAKTVAHGKIEFSSCKTWQGGKEKSGCKPKEPIVAGGLALLVLHKPTPELASENYVLLEPDPGIEAFTTIEFNGGTCGLPEKNKVMGEALAECGDLEAGGGGWVHLDCKNQEVVHLLREAPETEALFEHRLKYGTKKALVDGVATLEILGPAFYVGYAWSGHV